MVYYLKNKAYLSLIGFLFFIPASGQDQNIADSLIIALRNAEYHQDSLLQPILYEICFSHTNPDSIIHYSNLLLKASSDPSDIIWRHRAHLQLGNAYKLKGELSKALEEMFESAELSNLIGYSVGTAGVYNSIASVYRVQMNYDNALAYYNQAIQIFRDNNDSVKLATTLLNAGEAYRENLIYDSAISNFTESGRIFENVNYPIGKAYNLGNIGLAYAGQEKHDLAEEHLKEATAMLEKLGDSYGISVYDTYMADIYQGKGDYKRALQYAKRSYDGALEGGFKEQIRDACFKLSELHADLGDFEKAFNYQSQYLAYRDSINNEETIRKMADLRTEYEVSQKQAEVDLLNEQKRNQQIIGAGLAAVLLLAGSLAFTFYRNNKEKQRVNLILSEQKEEIEAQRDQLDELNKSKDKFFSIISHDLRGPVHAFKGMSRLIKMYIDQDSIHELAEINEHFDNSVDQLSTLLDDLLEWAVAQQGNVPYNPEKVKLDEVADELIGLFNNMARAKRIQLIGDVPDDLVLWADLNSVRTILRNLLNNALKFTPEGGWIKLSATRVGEKAEVKVEDSGIGIAQDKLETLFKLAGHKRSWGTEGEKGLGLGLQLVYEFSKMNGGEVRVESEEGKGTTFTLVVPVYSGEPVPSVQG